MGLGILTTVVGKLFGMGETWIEAKQERETAKVKNQIALDEAKTCAKITKEQKDADACNDIDLITVKNQQYTWTDEYVKVLFTLPFILMFLPWSQPYVMEGFKSFNNNTPEWYQYTIYGILISELGLRRIFMKLFDTMSTIRTGKK
jgi:hypothetical protein